MPPCNHEEADTRIVIHVLHALQSGCTSVLIRTVDTDVVVILVGKFDRLIAERSDADIWIAFGMGEHFHFISVNRVCVSLGETRARCLPVFHTLSGCDTTSVFVGKGKQSAWQDKNICKHFSDTITALCVIFFVSIQLFQIFLFSELS